MITLEKFNSFLETIDLDKYRNQYRNIKCFEADMPRNIQSLQTIYEVYWNNPIEPIPTFDTYFDKYYFSDMLKNEAIKFNKNSIGLCDVCFNKGIKARIYRTWASLITQIQAAYVAAKVFGRDNVEQSVELDHNGIDIKITYKNINIGIQIKKQTGRREIANRKPEKKEQNFVDKVIFLYYYVPTNDDIKNPKYLKDGRNHKKGQFKPFAELFGLDGSNPYLQRTKNGFIIFTEQYFNDIKSSIDEE